MDEAEAKQEILRVLKKSTKDSFYLKDFYKILPDWKKRKVTSLVNQMVQEGKLVYWSSGSTTLFKLPGEGKGI